MKNIRRFFITVFSCSLFVSNVSAQAPPWSQATAVSDSLYEHVMSMVADNDGNIYVTGMFQAPSIVFGSDTLWNTAVQNFFLVKYDVSGNIVWARSASGYTDIIPISIAVDPGGNILVAGYYNNYSLAFSFGSFTIWNNLSLGAADFFTVKYDSSGTVLWGARGGGENNDYLERVITDGNGNVYVCGYSDSDTLTFGSITVNNHAGLNYDEGMVLLKYDANGIIQWVYTSSAESPSLAFSLCTDNSGNVFVGGSYNDSLVIGGYSLVALNPANMFFLKLDTAGTVLWGQSGNGSFNSYYPVSAYDMRSDDSGNIFMCGSFGTDTLFLGSSVLVNTTAGYDDTFLAKWDNNGNVLWTRTDGGVREDIANKLLLNENGDIYISGYYRSSDLNFGNGIFPHAGSIYTNDVFTAKFDSIGQNLWSVSAGGSENEWITSMALPPMGELMISGVYESPQFTLGSFTLNNSGYFDGFFATLGSCSVSFTLQPDTLPLHWLALYQSSGTAPFTYAWSWGDGSTSTGATASHTYSSAGYYNICLTLSDATGCSTTYCDSSTYINRNESAMITVTAMNATTTGMQEYPTAEQLTLFPQPADAGFHIRCPDASKTIVELYDMTGRIVYTQRYWNSSLLYVETSNISPGTYHVSINQTGITFNRKVIISHPKDF